MDISADLHLTPKGRLLYGSNRGHDSIALYAVDQETEWLTHLYYTPAQGRWPQGFVIDPMGSLVLAVKQESDSVVTFWIDEDRGTILPTGNRVSKPSPVCLRVL